jgi:hypothetical protein
MVDREQEVNDNDDIGPPPILQRGYAVNIPVENEATIFEEAQGYKEINQIQQIQQNNNESIDASGAIEGCHQK